ncbi:hypothetical protein E2C01_078709 [Portunus trituberculatus]|uniref:Uncharacterized protein n=1 Tax=Portunus trituberculatus TaxID=210409 RepID=A0A5B7INH1_PORTR|nr:hypothetical protein [Portunus trituberculatus]
MKVVSRRIMAGSEGTFVSVAILPRRPLGTPADDMDDKNQYLIYVVMRRRGSRCLLQGTGGSRSHEFFHRGQEGIAGEWAGLGLGGALLLYSAIK